MKKILALLLALTMAVCFAACGNGGAESAASDSANASSGSQSGAQDETAKPAASSGKITLEDVMNAEESPESDFEIAVYGNGIVELTNYLGDDEIVVIPSSVNGKVITQIASFVFANDYHPNTKAVRLPDSVKVVNESTFALNESLEIFVAGSGLEEIGQASFMGCTNLSVVMLNDGLLRIIGAAFEGCDSLTEVEIPESVTDIQALNFYHMPENFKIIGKAGSVAEEYAKSEGINFQAK